MQPLDRKEGSISRTTRIVSALAGTVLVAGLVAWYVIGYVISLPQTVPQASAAGVTNVTLQTVASYGRPPHPDWVSYLVGQSGLRNPFLGQPRGVVGGTMTVDGKTLDVIDPDTASHTFTIPDLGVSVPLLGIEDDAKNQCAVTPCTLAQAHTTVTFEFRTGKPGLHRWQCFVPCAAGWLYGFGGPMQTVGWMDGFIKVV